MGKSQNSYIACLILKDHMWGLALLDLASGVLETAQSDDQARRFVSDELFKASPREIVFPKEQEQAVSKILSENGIVSAIKSPLEEWVFDFVQAKNFLIDHFKVRSVAGLALKTNLLLCLLPAHFFTISSN